MNHNKEKGIEPINVCSRKIGVTIENQFIVLDDAKHVIGIDPTDGGNVIIENVKNGKAGKFGWSASFQNYIITMVYDEDKEFLYTAVVEGRLYKYKVNTSSKTGQKIKEYGDLGIGHIGSSHRFMNFVFFGGKERKIRILDLSTGELLQGHLETSVGWTRSLQVCVKSHSEIYLAVSGSKIDYSNDRTDLFDLSGLIPNDPEILQKYL